MAVAQNHGDSRKSRHTAKITVKATVIMTIGDVIILQRYKKCHNE